MGNGRDERGKRPHLRLVVNNPEPRGGRPASEEPGFLPLEELIARRDELRAPYYRQLDRWQGKACQVLERYLQQRNWPYGLDPEHGRPLVIPMGALLGDPAEYGFSPQDELLCFLVQDAGGRGLSLAVEVILPFYDEDEAVMEDALLFAPILPYGSLFLEENRHDGYLDLIYRMAFPLYPAVPTGRLLEKFFGVAVFELTETLRSLAEYPG